MPDPPGPVEARTWKLEKRPQHAAGWEVVEPQSLTRHERVTVAAVEDMLAELADERDSAEDPLARAALSCAIRRVELRFLGG